MKPTLKTKFVVVLESLHHRNGEYSLHNRKSVVLVLASCPTKIIVSDTGPHPRGAYDVISSSGSFHPSPPKCIVPHVPHYLTRTILPIFLFYSASGAKVEATGIEFDRADVTTDQTRAKEPNTRQSDQRRGGAARWQAGKANPPWKQRCGDPAHSSSMALNADGMADGVVALSQRSGPTLVHLSSNHDRLPFSPTNAPPPLLHQCGRVWPHA